MIRNKKKFDAVEFKHKLQKNLAKNSETEDLKEYMEYINRIALKSPLFKKKWKINTADKVRNQFRNF